MRASYNSLSAWAYGLERRRCWQLWLCLAALGAGLFTFVPSPWSWVACLPIALLGFVMFDAQARRDRDETRRRATGPREPDAE